MYFNYIQCLLANDNEFRNKAFNYLNSGIYKYRVIYNAFEKSLINNPELNNEEMKYTKLVDYVIMYNIIY